MLTHTMTLPFSSRQSVRKLRDSDFSEPQANAIVEVVEDATGQLVTKEHFDSRDLATRSDVSDLRAEFYRAFAGLAGLIITVAGLALAAARWLF